MKNHCIKFCSLIILVLTTFFYQQMKGNSLTDSKGNPLPDKLLRPISIQLTNVPILEALSEIEKKANFYFNYDQEIMPVDKKVTINYDNTIVVVVLKKVLEGTDLDFVISKGGQVVLVRSTSKHIQRYTISGFILDAETGEVLIGSNIFDQKQRIVGTSNKYGFYSITLPEKHYEFRFSFIGYAIEYFEVMLNRNCKKNVELNPYPLYTDTITVNADIESNIVKSMEIGTTILDPKELKTMPVFLGEQDVLKSIQLLPGISRTKDGDAGFFVRGGNSDQNLVLLDEAPVYNAFHLMGFFSVFNSDAINNVKLIKGSAPPKYGGRISSVLDINMREGNSKKFTGNGGIGLIFSRLTLEGPIIADKSSFIISGRRTYADIFTSLSSNEDVKNSKLYFYDFNLKANYLISSNDRIFLSGYFGRDVLNFNKFIYTDSGNKTTTFRWNHLFNDQLFLNSSIVYSNFKYDVVVKDEEDDEDYDADESTSVKNKIDAISLKENFQYYHDTYNMFNFGLEYIYHNFLPGETAVRGEDNFNITIGRRHAHETALFASHEFKLKDDLKIEYGARYSFFSVHGQADIFNSEDIEDVTEVDLHKKESKLYRGLEPRLIINNMLNASSSIKFGYARNYQHVHLLSNATSGTPLDVWQPSSSRIKPQIGDQFSLGYFRNFSNKNYELSLEVFYKDMQNQTDYKNGANVLLSNFFESEIVFGKGWAYGLELMVKKKYGKLSGWVGYSLSKSLRKFKEINSGKPFPVKYDRTHDISVVCNYKIDNSWDFSANWIYYTGNAVTVPIGRYTVNDVQINAYSARNSYRMPAYHRLDIGFTYTTKKGHFWNIFLYNAYGRRNTYAIHFRENGDNIEVVRLSLYSFIPGITYNFKF